MNQERHCIIHYLQFKLKNQNKLIDVTKDTFQTIKDTKNARIKLGLNNMYHSQSDGIPNKFTERLGYHYECYNNLRG